MMRFEVCTRCFTYNQQEYIKDALDGFIKQKTSFSVVTVIVDDASTDKTADVIRRFFDDEFDNSYEGAIKEDRDYGQLLFSRHLTNKYCYFAILLLKENHYGKKPKAPYIKEWTENAKYHAICEGDDYWTDENKLQRQVDFLEAHPTYSALAENGVELFTETGRRRLFSKEPARFVTIEELMEKRRFPTASVLYRREALDDRYKTVKHHLDTMLWCFLASKGNFYYNAINSSVYRRGPGITMTVDPMRFAQMGESWYLELQSVFPENLSKTKMKMIIIRAYIAAADRYIKRRKYCREILLCYMKALCISPLLFLCQISKQYAMVIRRHLPSGKKRSYCGFN